MVRAGDRLAGKIVECAGQALGYPARIHEDQRGGTAANDLQQPGMNALPDGGALWLLRIRCGRLVHGRAQAGHVLDRDLDFQLERLARAGIHDGHGPVGNALRCSLSVVHCEVAGVESALRCEGDRLAGWLTSLLARDRTAKKTRHFLQRALGGGESDPLQGRAAAGTHQRLQAFQRQRQMRSALGGDERVNLVDDDSLDRAQALGGFRGEHQVERLRGGDEDVSGMPAKTRALAGRRVSGAHADGGNAYRHIRLLRHAGDAGQRSAQVALDVRGQRLERRDVDDAAAACGPVFARIEHELVQAGEERGQRFAGARGRQDQGRFAARDRGPALALRRGGRGECRAKPGCRNGMEEREGSSGIRVAGQLRRSGDVGWLRLRRCCGLAGVGSLRPG